MLLTNRVHKIIYSIFFVATLLISLNAKADFAQPPYPFLQPEIAPEPEQPASCSSDYYDFDFALAEVKKKNPDAVKNLVECLKFNRKLMFQIALIDVSQFQYASDILREDENFAYRLIKVNPEVLKYISPKLLLNKDFMERATYLNRDALKYANPKILDDKLFMRKMIDLDSKNYAFASSRLKELPEFASKALSDNGLLLSFAPDIIKNDEKFAKIAISSNVSAAAYLNDSLKNDPELQKFIKLKTGKITAKEDLENLIENNYIIPSDQKNLKATLGNKMKLSADHNIIDRNYVTKWQQLLKRGQEDLAKEENQLISADSKNYPISWKDDFKKYRGLTKKIEGFFLKHHLDQNTIDRLSTTYLWKIKDKPLTLAFNLYLLRDSKDAELGPEFADITSLTAIVQKSKNDWLLTVVEVIFDSEIKVDLPYPNGHKKYVLWDLYKTTKRDKNPKIIFKIEDRFKEYFEIFEEQNGGKYQMLYRINPFSNEIDEEIEL